MWKKKGFLTRIKCILFGHSSVVYPWGDNEQYRENLKEKREKLNLNTGDMLHVLPSKKRISGCMACGEVFMEEYYEQDK